MSEILVASPIAEEVEFDLKTASTISSIELENTSGYTTPNGHAHQDCVEHLTPRTHTPQPSPGTYRTDSILVSPDYYDDNCHDDYEWIKLPKKRNWDVVIIKRDTASERNTLNTPLKVTRHDGKSVIMWAKMDTGADANVINQSTLAALVGSEVESRKIPLDAEEAQNFKLIGDANFKPTHYVKLSFNAGKSRKQFDDIDFIVVPDDVAKSSQDGVPNLILGLPTLRQYLMVVMDLNYHMEPEVGLEVIAAKAEEEHEGYKFIGPIIKGPKRPGVVTVKGK